MSLRDVLEYRRANTATIVFALADLPAGDPTIYARPFGAQQWGYYSGPFEFDAEYKASHEAVAA
jgi:hypothetical protein